MGTRSIGSSDHHRTSLFLSLHRRFNFPLKPLLYELTVQTTTSESVTECLFTVPKFGGADHFQVSAPLVFATVDPWICRHDEIFTPGPFRGGDPIYHLVPCSNPIPLTLGYTRGYTRFGRFLPLCLDRRSFLSLNEVSLHGWNPRSADHSHVLYAICSETGMQLAADRLEYS